VRGYRPRHRPRCKGVSAKNSLMEMAPGATRGEAPGAPGRGVSSTAALIDFATANRFRHPNSALSAAVVRRPGTPIVCRSNARQVHRPTAVRTKRAAHDVTDGRPDRLLDSRHNSLISRTLRFSNSRPEFKRPFATPTCRKQGICVISRAGAKLRAGPSSALRASRLADRISSLPPASRTPKENQGVAQSHSALADGKGHGEVDGLLLLPLPPDPDALLDPDPPVAP
jgi:hypothetical protein